MRRNGGWRRISDTLRGRDWRSGDDLAVPDAIVARMSSQLSDLRHPVVVGAFEGWNDAADAASNVVSHLAQVYDAQFVFEIDGEEYYDFQESRPTIATIEGARRLTWPATRVLTAALPDRDLVLVTGPEPNLKWRSFTAALMAGLSLANPELVVLMGAMLTEEPHSRPLHVAAAADDPTVRERLGVGEPDYEGPTGIMGVIERACDEAHIPCVSVWGSVPHYVSSPPNPKATLTLLRRLEGILAEDLIQGDLPQQADLWERRVNDLASEDPDVAEYVAHLEESSDDTDLPEASGDAIAAEFQRYLRRHEQD